jgi:dipeptidyl aminopeptidase/acylaminoacyl peptidase
MLLLHGEKDSIIPPTVSRRSVLALQAVGAPHVYLEFPGKDHEFFIRRGAEQMEKIFLFFATVSKHTNVGFVTPDMAPPLPQGGRGRAGGPPPVR